MYSHFKTINPLGLWTMKDLGKDQARPWWRLESRGGYIRFYLCNSLNLLLPLSFSIRVSISIAQQWNERHTYQGPSLKFIFQFFINSWNCFFHSTNSYGSCHYGSAVMNPTSNHKDMGSIPGLNLWVRDPVRSCSAGHRCSSDVAQAS